MNEKEYRGWGDHLFYYYLRSKRYKRKYKSEFVSLTVFPFICFKNARNKTFVKRN